MTLAEADPELYGIIKQEKRRQRYAWGQVCRNPNSRQRELRVTGRVFRPGSR